MAERLASHAEHSPGTQAEGEVATAHRSRRRASQENAIRWDAPKAQLREPASQQVPAKQENAQRRSLKTNEGPKPNVEPKPKTEPGRLSEHMHATPEPHAVPESVRQQFVQVGKDFYFADGARAFTDKSVKLTTPSENSQVIRDLVLIAQARGWQRIAVSGTQRFKKEAWMVAREAGIAVRGYRASAFEEARLVRRLGRGEAPESAPGIARGRQRVQRVARPAHEVREPGPANAERRHAGRLVDHGPAPYQHDPHQAMSYFVKLETARGDRELWGVDLERAFRQSLSRPQIGDEVVVRAVRQEPVTVKSRSRDGEGKLVERALATHRNRWAIEKRAFLEGRVEAARTLRDASIAPAQGSRQHPELLGAYLQVHAAELAAKQFRDPEDQARFVAMVRGAVADSVARGEPMPAVRLRASQTRSGASGAGDAREKDGVAVARTAPGRS